MAAPNTQQMSHVVIQTPPAAPEVMTVSAILFVPNQGVFDQVLCLIRGGSPIALNRTTTDNQY